MGGAAIGLPLGLWILTGVSEDTARAVVSGYVLLMCAVLLEKPGKRAVNIVADHVGFECPDYFVVGYGMDVAHSYRQLPFVGVIETADQAWMLRMNFLFWIVDLY